MQNHCLLVGLRQRHYRLYEIYYPTKSNVTRCGTRNFYFLSHTFLFLLYYKHFYPCSTPKAINPLFSLEFIVFFPYKQPFLSLLSPELAVLAIISSFPGQFIVFQLLYSRNLSIMTFPFFHFTIICPVSTVQR